MSDSDSLAAGKHVRLHSRNPQLEADRYIDALNLSRDIDCYILIEPGMGYLIPALRRRCPDSRIIVLHADTVFRSTTISCDTLLPEIARWFPDSSTGIQEFLEAAIPETASIRIIEWKPSLRIYGNVCLTLVRESTEFIRRLEAGRRTSAAFGRRWVRNFFRNTALIRRTLLYRTVDMPIVITGSGPSLNSAVPAIRAAQEGVFILAASSSLPALINGGVMPDMVITTDGGAWALLHLHACFRGDCTPRSPLLACALTSALPSQCSDIPLLPMNDGSLWQSMALHSIGIPSVIIPQRGTVTASALDLALALSSGSIFLAGMDLAVRDIQTHARPYGFDQLFWGVASRLRPVYSQCFIRSGDMRAGGAHDVYAAWFRNRIASLPRRIFSIGGNHSAFENNLPIKPLTAAEHREKNYFKVMTVNGSPAEQRRRAAETLIAALGEMKYAAGLTGELAPLLFPKHAAIQPQKIADELRKITL
ncbi:MAG: DUF115 domain-containing protein [Treponema sp.]|nr:DUF115 domain-containing protein [Treponema sp.]